MASDIASNEGRAPPNQSKMPVAALLGQLDWERTSLGPRDAWSPATNTVVNLILASPVPIVTLWGVEGTMIYNDAYSGFAGSRHPQLFGSAVREGWPEVAAFNDHVMQMGLSGETLSYRDQELTLHRTGVPEQVWMNLDYSPIYGAEGHPIGVMAIVVETTDRVKGSHALQLNEARLSFLNALGVETSRTAEADEILRITTRMTGEYLGVTSCAYADMDADEDGFTIRGDWAAEGAQHIVGHYSLADFGALAVERLSAGLPLIISDNLAEIAPHEAATFQAIGIGATICMPLVKDGRLTALMAVHHRTRHDWTQHELAVLSEVTARSWAHIERVRSEAEVHEGERRFREELEQQVAERTEAAQRAEEALQHSRKLEAIGNLTGGIAHDFNNLLMPVIASLDLLRKRIPAEPSLYRLIDNALAGAKRGASLTARMLAFARRQELKVERTNLGVLVEGMAELLTRSMGAVTVRIKIEPDLPDVQADPGQLEASLLNLVLNARDAMHGEGDIDVEVQLARIEHDKGKLKAGTYVCLSVTDSGEGMDEQTLQRSVEPFFTTKGVGKGTGLGLPMVQGFAEQSGGVLSLKSSPGQGTRAEILLPTLASQSASAVPQNIAGDCRAVPKAFSMKVLVVDDDPLVLTTAVEMLEELGLDVVYCASGAEALNVLEGGRFDLVITDHAMPHMTGAELMQKIRRLYPDMPLVLATGYAELPDSLAADFLRLAKPYTMDELATILSKVSNSHA